jgi:uncharacterized protein
MSFYKSLLVACIVVAASTTSFAQNNFPKSSSATGYAEIEVEPDLATLTLTVVSKAPTSTAALAANAASSKDIVDALATLTKMEKTDYRNSISQSDDEVYDRDDKGNQTRKVVGQIATNTITVRTTHLDKLGAMIDLVTSKGAKNDYVSYGLINPQEVKEQALSKAGINAMANARAMLSPFGLKVGDVLQVDQSSEAPVRRFAANSLAAASVRSGPGGGAAPQTEVNAGLVTVTASVTVYFAIIK